MTFSIIVGQIVNDLLYPRGAKKSLNGEESRPTAAPPDRPAFIFHTYVTHSQDVSTNITEREKRGGEGSDRETNLPKCPDDGLNVQGGFRYTTSVHKGE